jgi:PAT family beta-lactamase induction signal transducer AmpG
LAVITLLGFSSGLPLALSSSTIEAWCAVSGLSLKTIGWLKLVAIAYVFKVLWAPIVDRYAFPWLTRRRGWMLATQLLMVAVLFGMSMAPPASALSLLAALAVMLAFFSATQDIAFNAYQADQLHAPERGLGAALGVGAYRVAMLTSGGLALVLADHAGFPTVMRLMALLLGIGVLGVALGGEIEVAPAPATLARAFIEPLVEFLGRARAWQWLALIVTYKLANAFALSLSSTFLLRGAGYTLSQVGWANKVFGFIALIVGALAGGLLLRRIPLWRALVLFGVLQTLANLGFYAVALGWQGMPALITAIGAENFFSGMGSAAFVALLMALTDARYSATQFALFTALDSIGRVFIGPLAGIVANDYGWSAYWALSIAFGVPGLLLLWRLNGAFSLLAARPAS